MGSLGDSIEPWRYRNRCRGVAIGFVALTLTACAAPTQYMGISLLPGAAEPALQQLANRARAGDKQAQLDLGIAFEEGLGVAVSPDRAKQLYKRAAATTGGIRWVYQPPVRQGGQGTVMPIDTGLKRIGLAEAKVRLGVICPLLSGPKLMIFWITKETRNAEQEASPGRDYRQAA